MMENSHINAESPADPQTLKEALSRPDTDKWIAGAKDEMKSLKEMGIYKMVQQSDVPKGRRVMKGKLCFILKHDEKGLLVRHKVRYIAKGFSAIYGQDYNKTTSPTMRAESFQTILHIGASKGWSVHQVDVKTTFSMGFCLKMRQYI